MLPSFTPAALAVSSVLAAKCAGLACHTADKNLVEPGGEKLKLLVEWVHADAPDQ